MHVLMIGTDRALLRDPHQLGDARQRHIAYAQILERLRPCSALHIIVRTDSTKKEAEVSLAPNLWCYGVGGNASSFVRRSLNRAKTLATRHPLDLITTQTPFLDGLVGCVLKRQWRIPLLVQLHLSRPDNLAWLREKPGNVVRYLIARWVIRQADGVRVSTEHMRCWLTHTWDIPQERIYVNPVSPACLVPDPTVGKSKHPTVLYVGRLTPEKGVDVLLKAFATIVTALPEAHLLIVGDGVARHALQSLASALGLNQNTVTFTGAISPSVLAPYYQHAWVVALPSRHESYGRVIIEACTLGRPVIATDTEGARTLIQEKVNGCIVPREDVSSLAKRLLFLLTHPEVADLMGKRGAEMAKAYPQAQHLRREFVNIWLAVADRPTWLR